ncbi:MAG: hypothetical protein JSU00_08155 [Acidobacteria bacterium]|nr:hypothetical protein [Acidobacteriota bacterium]
MSPKQNFAILIVISGLIGAFLITAQVSTTPLQPYTVRYASVEGPVQPVTKAARRADGVTAEFTYDGASGVLERQNILDIKGLDHIRYDPISNTVWKRPLTKQEYSELKASPRTCGQATLNEGVCIQHAGQMLGQTVDRHEFATALPDGSEIKVVEYLAPNLGYLLLRREEITREEKRIRQATELTVGEADASLFNIPPGARPIADYRQFIETAAKARTGSVPASYQTYLDRFEKQERRLKETGQFMK